MLQTSIDSRLLTLEDAICMNAIEIVSKLVSDGARVNSCDSYLTITARKR